MTPGTVVDILKLGSIGLGFLLALLAYRLLNREQDRDTPRQGILSTIRFYMGFAVLLCCLGLVAEVSPTVLSMLSTSAATHKHLTDSIIVLERHHLVLLDSTNALTARDSRFAQTCKHLRTTNWLDKAPAEMVRSLTQYC